MNALVRRSIIYMILSISIILALLLVWRVMSHPEREGMPHTEREETAFLKPGDWKTLPCQASKDNPAI